MLRVNKKLGRLQLRDSNLENRLMTQTQSAVSNCRLMALLIVAVGGTVLVPHLAWAQAAREHKDVIYATVDGKDLGLDIYLPPGVETPPRRDGGDGCAPRHAVCRSRDSPLAAVHR